LFQLEPEKCYLEEEEEEEGGASQRDLKQNPSGRILGPDGFKNVMDFGRFSRG
jgi:hypothetical protein